MIKVGMAGSDKEKRRGPKPKGKVKIVWSSDFAYGIGLLVSDGCLSPDGRHIIFVSKDTDQIDNFRKAFRITKIKIGQTTSGNKETNALRMQFGDVLFCKFLIGIGITQAKSKTVGRIDVPKEYFFDFLRGSFDGDGTSYSYWDPRWKSSFMFYTEFASASRNHIVWIRQEIFSRLNISGHVTKDRKGTTYQLKYAKKDSLKLLQRLYAGRKPLHLKRKRLKIDKALSMIGESLKDY